MANWTLQTSWLGCPFLCLREGDYQRATEYVQEATDIRKAVEPKLTESQKQSLEKIIGLQQDAFTQLQDHSWFGGILASVDLSEASQESAKLRNSVLSSGQLTAVA